MTRCVHGVRTDSPTTCYQCSPEEFERELEDANRLRLDAEDEREELEKELSCAKAVIEAARRMASRFDRERYPIVAENFEFALAVYDAVPKSRT